MFEKCALCDIIYRDMKNVLIRLDEQTYEQLKLKAKGAHTSMAGLVREATTKYLAGESLRAADPILALKGKAGGKRKDAAAKHDKYIYGRQD
ncbi:MAG: hypothetical protein Q8L35_05805 [Actinomycetota bacterium]|nr:hypothetical protein [Actinomycetota bacterium]